MTGCSESALNSGGPRTIIYIKTYKIKISVVFTKVLYCFKSGMESFYLTESKIEKDSFF